MNTQDLAATLPTHISQIDVMDVWIEKYGTSGNVSFVKMAEMLANVAYGKLAIINLGEYCHGVTISSSITKNYKLLRTLKRDDGYWTMHCILANVDLYYDEDGSISYTQRHYD